MKFSTALINKFLKKAIRGEWWIDDTGRAEFADGDIGDFNHAAIAFQAALGISFDDPSIPDMTPFEPLSLEALKYLNEIGADKKAIDFLKDGSDPRDYALKNLNWIRVKNNYIQFWELNSSILDHLKNFVYEEIENEGQNPEETEDTVYLEQLSDRSFWEIPINVLIRATPEYIKYYGGRHKAIRKK
jgi:hypothetical protein